MDKLLEVMPRIAMVLSRRWVMVVKRRGWILRWVVMKMILANLALETRFPQSITKKMPTNLVNFVLQSLWVSLEMWCSPLNCLGCKLLLQEQKLR